jgi:hypothetical protein
VVEALFIGCWSLISGISPKATCSRPSVITGRLILGGGWLRSFISQMQKMKANSGSRWHCQGYLRA